MRYFFLIALCAVAMPALAQTTNEMNNAVESVAPVTEKNDLDERIILSKKLHEIKPIKPQIDRAIETVASRLRESDQKAFAATIRRIVNYNVLEAVSVKATAEIFTVKELEVMIDYHSKPEAKSAAEKQEDYQERIRPEITKMLDKALMEMRTGRSGN